GTSLYIGDVTLQRLLQESPGLVGGVAGQDPGGHDGAECGAVGGACQVVIDSPGQLFLAYLVTKMSEQTAELVPRQKVEQHQYIGLLGDFVAIRSVAFSFEYAVQSLDVAVLVPVTLPVEFEQLLVALELAQHTVDVEHDGHLPADVAPPCQLLVADRQLLDQLLAIVRRKLLQCPQCLL